MMTSVFILDDLIRQGRIRAGWSSAAEFISELRRNAAQEIRTVIDGELASLTLGDAGAGAISNARRRALPGSKWPLHDAVRAQPLFVTFPAKIGPGVTIRTEARGIHRAATKDTVPMLREVLDQAGLEFDEIDYLIPHQTSARAIKKAMAEFSRASVQRRSTW